MRALWKKAFREARWLLLAGALLLIAFLWVRVWMVSQLKTADFRLILQITRTFTQRLSPIPLDELASTLGRISVGFNEPLVVLIMTVWGIGRGSDAVAGEIGRGTMELLLAQPVRRITLLATQATTTLLGAAVLALAAWLGMAMGIVTVSLEDAIHAAELTPGAFNLFALGVFLAGTSTLASSVARSRGWAISVMGGLYVYATVTKIVARVDPRWEWLGYTSFFTPYEPMVIVLREDRAWRLFSEGAKGELLLGGLGQSGILLGLGVACYLLAAAIFCHRDVPAPV